MKKIRRCLYYIILLSICLVFQVSAISDEQKNAIVDYCNAITTSLKTVQRDDARARVYLGGKYETILTKFIMPLNVRLVENSLSDVSLIENQNNFAEKKKSFVNDYVSYQKGLEELVLMDCRENPEGFYEKLTSVRKKRKKVGQEVSEMDALMKEHVKLVKELMKKVKDGK